MRSSLSHKITLLSGKGLSALLAILFLFSSCLSYDQIDLKKVNNLQVNEFTREKMVVTFNVRLHNPNGYKIKIVKGDLDLFIGGTEAGKARLSKKVKLKKRSEEDYDIIVEADLKDLGKALLNSSLTIALTRSAPVKIKGWIKGRVFVFGKKFRVEFKENVDLSKFKLPSF